jgi:CubicO group peptidase (beta-lactamase class C family)
VRHQLVIMSHRISRRVCLLLLSAAIVAGGLVSAREAPAPGGYDAIDDFRERLRADVAADAVGGITAAVVVGDDIVWAEGFGWADYDQQIPAGIETIYRIGSLTKTFTAAVLAQLVDRRVLALDDPVQKYLPEVRGLANGPWLFGKPITFRQLASHTAGLVREPGLPGAGSGPIAEWEAKVLASIPTTAVDARPGTRYSYSNIGYGVLGLALSRAARTPFMELVDDGIFAPLGMTSSTFVISDGLLPRLSVGYANTGTLIDVQTPARRRLSPGYGVPSGGIYSTVGDLARLVGALNGAGAGVTSETMRVAMQTRQTPAYGDAYGLGLYLYTTAGTVSIAGHSGAVSGYTAYLGFDPNSKVGVILLRNYESGRTNLASAANQLIRAIAPARF